MSLVDSKRSLDHVYSCMVYLVQSYERTDERTESLRKKLELAKDEEKKCDRLKQKYSEYVKDLDALYDGISFIDTAYNNELISFIEELVLAVSLPGVNMGTVSIACEPYEDDIHVYFGYKDGNSPTHFLGHYIVNLEENSISRCEIDGPFNKNGEKMMIKYPFFDQDIVKQKDALAEKADETNDVVISPPEKDKNN